jgi:serine/threonine-protein kinase
VGIYVDAKPKVDAVAMQINTPAPGWHAVIYGAPAGPVPKSVPAGWTKLGGGTVGKKDQPFSLDTGGTAYRYYLVWITQLAPDAERVEISEIRLFQKVAAG